MGWVHGTLFEGTGRAPVRDMVVRPVSTQEVGVFCSQWHYTQTGGSSKSGRYGLVDADGFTILGIVTYNVPTMTVCAAVFGADHWRSVRHMGRLVCSPAAPKNSESRLIGGSLKLLAQENPEVRAVLTYAAVDAGHIGTVYQATNALYTGMGGEAWYYLDAEGKRRSTYLTGSRVSPQRAAALGWQRVEGARKHRYLYLVGSKRQRKESRGMLRMPVLPYPKR